MCNIRTCWSVSIGQLEQVIRYVMVVIVLSIMIFYCRLMLIYHSVLNVKVLVGAFNQWRALVWAFSVNVKLQTSRRFVSSSNTDTNINTIR